MPAGERILGAARRRAAPAAPSAGGAAARPARRRWSRAPSCSFRGAGSGPAGRASTPHPVPDDPDVGRGAEGPARLGDTGPGLPARPPRPARPARSSARASPGSRSGLAVEAAYQPGQFAILEPVTGCGDATRSPGCPAPTRCSSSRSATRRLREHRPVRSADWRGDPRRAALRRHVRPGGRPVLLAAGGTGISAVLAMAEQLALRRDPRSVHVFYGAGSSAELVCWDELEQAMAALRGRAPARCAARGAGRLGRGSRVRHHGAGRAATAADGCRVPRRRAAPDDRLDRRPVARERHPARPRALRQLRLARSHAAGAPRPRAPRGDGRRGDDDPAPTARVGWGGQKPPSRAMLLNRE